MNIQNFRKYQIELCNLLLKEKMINSRIEKKIQSFTKTKELNKFQKLISTKKYRLLELYNISSILGIEIEISKCLRDIDIINFVELKKNILSKLPFDKKRNKFIYNLAKENFPKIFISILLNSKTDLDFDKKIEEIPYAILVRCGIKKSSKFYDMTTKSVRAINSPFGGKVR